MNCCVDCFSSKYLKSIIGSTSTVGNCDFCGSQQVHLLEAKELGRFFRNLLDQYKLDAGGASIEIQIENDFPKLIFSSKNFDKKNLITNILQEDSSVYESLLAGTVLLKNIANQDNALKLWDNFKNEIKSTNRFHIKNVLNLEKLKATFEKDESFQKTIKEGSCYFRSRQSDKNGLKLSEMGNPPPEKASAGRANPKGISYLYLSDTPETTLYEIRSTLFDYVTVGKFEAKKETKVLNLRNFVHDPMFWTENEEIEHFLIYSPFVDKFQEDLSRPIRRGDSEIDYLPTQYLSEFIKSVGFEGVEFQSSLYKEGYNLAIFRPENFECISVEVYEIKSLELKHEKVTKPPMEGS